MSLRIGGLALSSNLCLAPLAGYTNLPFRLVIRELGGVGLCTTDLVNARGLLGRNRKSMELIRTRPEDRPLAVQLFGAVAEEMRDAALYLESLGVAAVDVNMGCPAPKVCRGGAGSRMMTDPAGSATLVGAMVRALRVPVTCKMRLGWDDGNLTAPDLARALEDAGAAAITVHGRTRAQGFGGAVRLDGIRAVVKAVRSIPVIGNGDVTSPEAARRMLEETGCAGVSIGRGAFYNPWIFRQTRRLLDTGERLPAPPVEEILGVLGRHLDLMVEVFGEEHGCKMFRKAALRSSRAFGPSVEFHRRVARLSRREEFAGIAAGFLEWRRRFLDADGNLLPQYRPASGGDGGAPIRVPSGPVERW